MFFVAIKGLYSHQPARSCRDILDSGDSRGDGEYWIVPEGRGNPLKVFCDMTTDGGKANGKIHDLNNLKTAKGHTVIASLSNLRDGNAEDIVH